MSPSGHWYGRGPAVWRVGDAMLAVVVLVGVMVAGNLHHMPRGVAEFLAVRVEMKNVLLLAAFAWAWPAVLSLCGLYAPIRLRTGVDEWPRLALAGAIGCVLAMIFPLTSVSGLITPWHVLAFGLAIVPSERLLRTIVRAVTKPLPTMEPRQIVLVGSGPLANRLYRQLVSDPLRNVTILGFVDSVPQTSLAHTGSTHLGSVSELETILMRRVVDDVFIGLPVKSCYDDIRASLAACARVGVRATYSGDLFDGSFGQLRAEHGIAPVLSMSHTPRGELLAVKRIMDIVGASLLLIAFAPLMLVIALIIRLTSHGPIVFSQDRYGHMKRLFRMYKFRTMVADAESQHAQLEIYNEATGPAFKIRHDPRITPVGRFLRRTSLDELPQLWHVLTGEMSLVGPRPMATRDVDLFSEAWLMRRFSMRPGLTCLWQVSGRSDLHFSRWIELDLEYIDHWSLWLDVKILLRTVPAVCTGRGAQ